MSPREDVAVLIRANAQISSATDLQNTQPPVVSPDVATPVVSADVATPVVSADVATPVVSADVATPVVSTDVATPGVSTDVTTPVVSADAAAKALEGLRLAMVDLESNVFPTDNEEVFQKVFNFVYDLRKYIESLDGNINRGLFKNESPLAEAHKTVALLDRHLKLTRFYDATEEQRLSRGLSAQDAELELLEKRGEAAKKAVLNLLHQTESYLSALTGLT
ncbi:hypothetical protein [Arthrobacter sp. CAN_C5]|uniref:hypothetical protein n=1 Tax=Arthrobacter sp. CAN_C5 TaxID=2760706 RepID=UPI001AE1CAC7|nr:hypothetical protein [Arthrobacter sp. CAN_C5]MBP2216797.1 hypothetical protein [Arthrobacter sp. CAN_C5]